MSDGIHIACLAAHKVTGTLFIIESKIFLQQFAVDFVTHIIENALGSGLKHKLIVKA